MLETGNIKALNDLLTKLVKSIQDRQFAGELREVQTLVAALNSENFGLRNECLKLKSDNFELKQAITALQKRIADAQAQEQDEFKEICFYKSIKFMRGKITGGKWTAICPKCSETPAKGDTLPSGTHIIFCTAQCGWRTCPDESLDVITRELGV